MKHNHQHDHCKHKNLAYCDHCDQAYCKDCDKNWYKNNNNGWSWISGGTQYLNGGSGTVLCSSTDTALTSAVTNCNHQ